MITSRKKAIASKMAAVNMGASVGPFEAFRPITRTCRAQLAFRQL
jgi:hypothetical protein